MEIAVLMKDKEHLHKSIRDLQVRLRSGDIDAQMEMDKDEAKLRDIDSRLAAEFQRGEASGRVSGITLGKKQAQTDFEKVSAEYESRIAKFESELKAERERFTADESKFRQDLQRMRSEMESESHATC